MTEVPIATYDFAGTGAIPSALWVQLNTTAGADLERTNGFGSPESATLACFARWSAATFDSNQYSKCIAHAVISYDQYCNVGVRETGTTNNDGYEIFLDGASGTPQHSNLTRFDSGGETAISDFDSGGFSNDDEIKIIMEGSSIKMYVNDSQIGSTETDTTYVSGQPSCGVYDSDGSDTEMIDNWEGGNIIVIPTIGQLFPRGTHGTIPLVGQLFPRTDVVMP